MTTTTFGTFGTNFGTVFACGLNRSNGPTTHVVVGRDRDRDRATYTVRTLSHVWHSVTFYSYCNTVQKLHRVWQITSNNNRYSTECTVYASRIHVASKVHHMLFWNGYNIDRLNKVQSTLCSNSITELHQEITAGFPFKIYWVRSENTNAKTQTQTQIFVFVTCWGSGNTNKMVTQMATRMS
jgi:hypothetical protein